MPLRPTLVAALETSAKKTAPNRVATPNPSKKTATRVIVTVIVTAQKSVSANATLKRLLSNIDLRPILTKILVARDARVHDQTRDRTRVEKNPRQIIRAKIRRHHHHVIKVANQVRPSTRVATRTATRTTKKL